MAKTKSDYARLAKEHLDKGERELRAWSKKRHLPKGYLEFPEFERAAENYARAGMEKEAYRCIKKAEYLWMEGQEKLHPGWTKHVKKAQKVDRQKINKLLSEARGEGLVDKILRAIRFRYKEVSVIILAIIGSYFLFSKGKITGSVVTNLNGIGSSFLVNFILLGILGLVCYSYLK